MFFRIFLIAWFAIVLQAQSITKDLIKNSWEDYTFLHQNPELSNKEYQTKQYIKKRLQAIPHLEIKEILDTGLVVWSKKFSDKDPSVIIRAEMDALPIVENPEHRIKSKNYGVMHACGHDVHMAIALGICRLLHDLPLRVTVLFQPAEEKRGGADQIVENHLLDFLHPKYFLALHIDPSLTIGHFKYSPEANLAGSLYFDLYFSGPGGHVAEMERNIFNPVEQGAFFCIDFPKMLRAKYPQKKYLLRFTSFQGGKAANFIARQVKIKGALRTFDDTLFHTIDREINNYLHRKNWTKNCRYELRKGTPPMINSPKLAKIFVQSIRKKFQVKKVPPAYFSDDFSYYRQIAPIFMFALGAKKQNSPASYLHNPELSIAPQTIALGIESWLLFFRGLSEEMNNE